MKHTLHLTNNVDEGEEEAWSMLISLLASNEKPLPRWTICSSRAYPVNCDWSNGLEEWW